MKVKIKVDWMGAGRTGVSLGQNVFVEQWWMPVKWDNEDDPCFHKTAALEFEEAELPASDNTTKTKICGNTLESDIICMYCKKGSSGKCTECFYNKYEDFKGRKLYSYNV